MCADRSMRPIPKRNTAQTRTTPYTFRLRSAPEAVFETAVPHNPIHFDAVSKRPGRIFHQPLKDCGFDSCHGVLVGSSAQKCRNVVAVDSTRLFVPELVQGFTQAFNNVSVSKLILEDFAQL